MRIVKYAMLTSENGRIQKRFWLREHIGYFGWMADDSPWFFIECPDERTADQQLREGLERSEWYGGAQGQLSFFEMPKEESRWS